MNTGSEDKQMQTSPFTVGFWKEKKRSKGESEFKALGINHVNDNNNNVTVTIIMMMMKAAITC
jgi:di/tripeptidase